MIEKEKNAISFYFTFFAERNLSFQDGNNLYVDYIYTVPYVRFFLHNLMYMCSFCFTWCDKSLASALDESSMFFSMTTAKNIHTRRRPFILSEEKDIEKKERCIFSSITRRRRERTDVRLVW